ncbi:hypothetical protein KI387_044447, partial [Taxus chinensis]
MGRELADLPKDGPFRAVRGFLSGTTGTKVHEGRKKVKRPQKRQGSPNRPMRENVSGIAGKKVRAGCEGREKLKRPKAKKKSQ